MSVEDRFKKRYKKGDTPWDIGKPDFNLIETVTNTPIKSCQAWILVVEPVTIQYGSPKSTFK